MPRNVVGCMNDACAMPDLYGLQKVVESGL